MGAFHMDYKSVYEVANQLNVSHTTIYNKLNNKQIYKELKPFIKKKGKAKLISSEGIILLKKYINLKSTSEKSSKLESNTFDKVTERTENTATLSDINNLQETLIASLQNQIKQLEKDNEFLKTELEAKNKHIETQARLLENSQILLRDQQQKILMLESESKTERKSLLKRFFRK